MKTAQLYGARMTLHCTGTLEALAPDGKVIKSQRVRWRNERFAGQNQTQSVAVIKLVGNYSGGPYFSEEVIY